MPTLTVDDLLGLSWLLAAGLVVYVAVLIGSTIWRLLQPSRRGYAWAVSRNLPGDPSEAGGREYSSWSLDRGRAELAVWDVPGDAPAGPVIVLTHGWSSSRVSGLTRLPAAAAVASRVTLWDMRGHGDSGGTTTIGDREPADLRALLGRLETDRPVVLWGWSLGAEVSLAVAAAGSGQPPEIAGVIAENPYRRRITPAANVARRFGYPVRPNLQIAAVLLGLWHARDPRRWFRDRQSPTAASLGVPLLVLHGEQDTTCPVAEGRAIAEAVGDRARLAVIADAGHHTIWTGTEQTEAAREAVASFVSGLGARDQ